MPSILAWKGYRPESKCKKAIATLNKNFVSYAEQGIKRVSVNRLERRKYTK